MMLQVTVAWQTMIQEVQFEYQIHEFGDFSQLTVITRTMVEELVCKGTVEFLLQSNSSRMCVCMCLIGYHSYVC